QLLEGDNQETTNFDDSFFFPPTPPTRAPALVLPQQDDIEHNVAVRPLVDYAQTPSPTDVRAATQQENVFIYAEMKINDESINLITSTIPTSQSLPPLTSIESLLLQPVNIENNKKEKEENEEENEVWALI
uniref:Uncharacterized protein n=1 Tax=Meloidogyne javanica TaxID=6303 RepID=A0A915MB97_MELJA